LIEAGVSQEAIDEIKTHAWDAIGIGLWALGSI
jgi:hypothetical protein